MRVQRAMACMQYCALLCCRLITIGRVYLLLLELSPRSCLIHHLSIHVSAHDFHSHYARYPSLLKSFIPGLRRTFSQISLPQTAGTFRTGFTHSWTVYWIFKPIGFSLSSFVRWTSVWFCAVDLAGCSSIFKCTLKCNYLIDICANISHHHAVIPVDIYWK